MTTYFQLKTSRISNILFDLGGIFFEFNWKQMFQSIALYSPLSKFQIENLIIKNEVINNYEKGKISTEQFYDQIITVTQSEISWPVFINNLSKCDPILQNLKSLKLLEGKVPIGLLSNTNSVHADTVFKYPGFKQTFSDIYFSYQTGLLKPDPDFYNLVINNLNVPASSIIFIDDNINNVTGAKKAGIRTYHYKNPLQLRLLITEVFLPFLHNSPIIKASSETEENIHNKGEGYEPKNGTNHFTNADFESKAGGMAETMGKGGPACSWS